MDWDFELLADKNISEVKRLVNEYSMFVGNQRIGIKVYFDENGFYQMETSHFYQGKNNAGAYITTAVNFETEQEALKELRTNFWLSTMDRESGMKTKSILYRGGRS